MFLLLSQRFTHSGPFVGTMTAPRVLGHFETLEEAVTKSDAHLEACRMFRPGKDTVVTWTLDLETDQVVDASELPHEDSEELGPNSVVEMMTGRSM